VTAIHLLRRGERAAILATAAILTAAFFLVPTRSHERYLFPLFVYAAPLAALSLRWAGWYLLLGLANAANLYGVLTFYGTPTVAALPGGDVLRSPVAIALLAITQALLVAWAAWQVARGRAPDPARGAVPERPDAPAHVPSRARA
jgi:hypothetical protein